MKPVTTRDITDIRVVTPVVSVAQLDSRAWQPLDDSMYFEVDVEQISTTYLPTGIVEETTEELHVGERLEIKDDKVFLNGQAVNATLPSWMRVRYVRR